jgi:small subunit ribosomal protein S6
MRRRMASEAPVYDLVLLLDTTIEQERRDTILANVEDAIDRGGEIVGRHDWGNRHTVYEVRKHGEADYHLIQFRGSAALLEQLDHNLKITDGILRFRIIKLRPGTPPPPDLRPAAMAAAAPVSSRSTRQSSRLRNAVQKDCEQIAAICGTAAVTAGPRPRLGHPRFLRKTLSSRKEGHRGRHQHQPGRPYRQPDA